MRWGVQRAALLQHAGLHVFAMLERCLDQVAPQARWRESVAAGAEELADVRLSDGL